MEKKLLLLLFRVVPHHKACLKRKRQKEIKKRLRKVKSKNETK